MDASIAIWTAVRSWGKERGPFMRNKRDIHQLLSKQAADYVRIGAKNKW